ncbi:MAG: hypothetical protein AAFQ82_04050 [Myxococcota bacterium]
MNTSAGEPLRVLIVEDGDEYLDNLTRYVQGPVYSQAHNLADAVRHLQDAVVDVVYLDMRFDRIPEEQLVGDREDALRRHHGDRERAVRHLQTHQGLYILKALADAGFGEMPTVLAYDFRRELARFKRLKERYPRLEWVADTVSADEIHALLASLAS